MIYEKIQILNIDVDNLLEAIAKSLPSAMQTCLRRNERGAHRASRRPRASDSRRSEGGGEMTVQASPATLFP